MDDAELRQYLMSISEVAVRKTTSEAIGAATVASVFGSQIPVGATRNIWSMIASPRSGTGQELQVTIGDATSGYENVINLRQQLLGTVQELLSGDPLTPARRVAPVQTSGTNDRMVATHETDAIDLEVSYYDTPIYLSQ